jgi:hypothetical protein
MRVPNFPRSGFPTDADLIDEVLDLLYPTKEERDLYHVDVVIEAQSPAEEDLTGEKGTHPCANA